MDRVLKKAENKFNNMAFQMEEKDCCGSFTVPLHAD